jgi:hypothetical protein
MAGRKAPRDGPRDTVAPEVFFYQANRRGAVSMPRTKCGPCGHCGNETATVRVAARGVDRAYVGIAA